MQYFQKIFILKAALPHSTISIDQNIKGANIKIFYNDSVFVMRDTTLQMTADSEI